MPIAKWGALVLIGLALLTAFHVPVFRSDVALWTHAITITPANARAALNLGTAYLVTRDVCAADRWFRRTRFLVRASRYDGTRAAITALLEDHELFVSYFASPCG